jgi:hypothetical protein
MTPWVVLVVACPADHWEATTKRAFHGPAKRCARCRRLLTVMREALIQPDRKHSDMPCRQDGRECVLVF